jgi:hypothetical protein
MSHPHAILILAVTRMRVGVCVAGLNGAADPSSQLHWVRPIKQRGPLLLGDIRYAGGALMRVGDLIDWRLGDPRPDPPHVEDVLVNPIRDRAVLLRQLDSQQRAEFCAQHIDRNPTDVLRFEQRSLCLLQPDRVSASWHRDSYNGRYDPRIAFQWRDFATDERGYPVTDLAWRALGRDWLQNREQLVLDHAALRERIGAIYLGVGRGRQFEGHHWALIVGVHAVGLPEVKIDEHSL